MERAGATRARAPATRLGEVAAPALVLSGQCDVPEIREVSDELTAGIPGAHHVALPDTGHLPPLERPQAVPAALRDLLPR